jgi:hypothetical protein
MTPEALKNRVVEEFESSGLLKSLDVETSAFDELPRFFQGIHLSMRLVLDDVGAVAMASSIAAEIKRDLERQGIELEYEIRTQWKVVNLDYDKAERCEDTGTIPSEGLPVEVESSSVRRHVAVHVSTGARTYILHYFAHVPPSYRQSAINKLLETCINQKLATCAEEYWDPVLYPSRNIELQDVIRLVENRVDWTEPELISGI